MSGLIPCCGVKNFISFFVTGVDPTIMGIGPADAIKKLCDNTGIKLKDVDLIDVSYAFMYQWKQL